MLRSRPLLRDACCLGSISLCRAAGRSLRVSELGSEPSCQSLMAVAPRQPQSPCRAPSSRAGTCRVLGYGALL